MAPSSDNPAYVQKERRPNAKLRLFCFTYAGASALSFMNWIEYVPEFIEVIGFELPGHGRRLIDGTPFRTYQDAAAYIADNLNSALGPYALFGHCLGGILAYEATRILSSRGSQLPLHLFTSGARGPHHGIPIADVNNMNDEQFVEHFISAYGASMAVLKNPQMRPLVLPVVRADAYMTQTYSYSSGATVSYGITAIAGEQDTDVNLEQLKGWKQHTTGPVTVQLYKGDHFFFLQSAPQMLADLSKQLETYLT
jgi:medium-chain acyl-[acyl-carrier-protein] hydrolase